MIELLLLLLPVAAASGWIAAKRAGGKRSARMSRYDPAYFKGLNYVLNEQPDKAIDIFVKLLEVDSETVETHLALGNLFRRRGEVDRAIRIHQNLIARSTLDSGERALALLELGMDYMRAGLFDRAERLFSELAEMGFYTRQALSNLQEIYQQEKDWRNCLDVARRLEDETRKSQHVAIAHYYCELAREALNNDDTDTAWSLIQKAQSADKNCVRATMLRAEMEVKAGKCDQAIESYRKVEQQDADYLSEVLPRIIECHKAAGKEDVLGEYLLTAYDTHRNSFVLVALVNYIEAEQGASAAIAFLNEELKRLPNLSGVLQLLDLRLGNEDASHDRDILAVLRKLISDLMKEQPTYQCSRCGFTASKLHWQCPGCKTWGSVKPVQQHYAPLDSNKR